MTNINWIEKYMADAEQMFYDNREEEGFGVLQNLLYEEPGYGRLHNHLGWAYLYYSDDVARSELHLKMAIRFDAAYSPAYLHLGVLYIRQGRYGDAISALQTRLTKPQSNRVALLQNLAQAYELRGEWGKAIKAYKEAIINSIVEHEVYNLMAGVKRCRKKRLTLFFSKP